MAAAAAKTNQQPLSSKEAALFRQVVKNYEQKQHKKGTLSCSYFSNNEN